MVVRPIKFANATFKKRGLFVKNLEHKIRKKQMTQPNILPKCSFDLAIPISCEVSK